MLRCALQSAITIPRGGGARNWLHANAIFFGEADRRWWMTDAVVIGREQWCPAFPRWSHASGPAQGLYFGAGCIDARKKLFGSRTSAKWLMADADGGQLRCCKLSRLPSAIGHDSA